MTTVRYVVPGKPAGQNRNGWAGGAWTKHPLARAFADRLATHGRNARLDAGWATTQDPVEVELRIFFADERPDTDSPVKAILDSLEVSRPRLRRPGAGFVENDRQVRAYRVERAVDRDSPRVEVTIQKSARVPRRPVSEIEREDEVHATNGRRDG